MTRLSTRAAGAVLAAALVPAALVPLAAATPASAAPPAVMDMPHLEVAGTQAAELRAVLTAAFQEHDALANLTAATYVRKGLRLGDAAAAVTAQVRQTLARGVGGLSTDAAAFRNALAASDAAKLDYARAVDRSGSPSGSRAAAAQAAVLRTRGVVATTLTQLVPGLSTVRVAGLLATTDAADAAAARALGVRSPSVYSLVETAHLSTAPLAKEVAVALDGAKSLSGSATSPTAELRARTVTQSVAHPFQTGLASDAALTYGLGSAQYAGAKKALDANTAALTRLVTELSYPANGVSFDRQWNRHLNDYATYVRGLQTRNAGLRTAAATDLGGFVRDNAVQLSRVSGLSAASLVPQLKVHAAGTLEVIRLQAAGSPQQFPAAAMGTNHFAQVGDLLASSAAERRGLTP